jgi:hypothetical protein
MYDQLVAVYEKGRSGSLDMLTLQVGSFPNLLSRCGVETGSAIASEMNIDPALLNGRCGCGIGVDSMYSEEFFRSKNKHVVKLLTALKVQANGTHLFLLLAGSGQPNLLVQYHR